MYVVYCFFVHHADCCYAAVQVHALKKLHEAVDYHWAEISESVSNIEGLFEDADFPERELAAAVASKVSCPLNRLGHRLVMAGTFGNRFCDLLAVLLPSGGVRRCTASGSWCGTVL